MRILISSNGPHTPTGYGTQAKSLWKIFRSMGHEVHFFSWWGMQGGSIQIGETKILPRLAHPYGGDADLWAQQIDADLLVTLQDTWVLPEDFSEYLPCPWLSYFPVDSTPTPRGPDCQSEGR